MKKLPLSNFTFSGIIEDNYLYIDKTRQLYDLINYSKYMFLSRPRRFGKSMLVSTLKSFYQGKKELFKGLWIEDKVEWKKYPVIHIDFSGVITSESKAVFNRSFCQRLKRIEDEYNLDINISSSPDYFNALIYELYKKFQQRVIILIDEYDKPITDHITNIEKAEECRGWLREYYAVLKPNEGIIKQIFITGISKFAKISIFSVLNNVQDITLLPQFNNIVGFTKEDIKTGFSAYLNVFSEKTGLTQEELLDKITLWYDGYSWNGIDKIYNPYSIVNLLAGTIFNNFWFESGTPTMLIDFIVEKTERGEISNDPTHYEGYEASSGELDNMDIKNINIYGLLFQTGYLTVKKAIYEEGMPFYILGYPNFEVKWSFTSHILEAYTQTTRYSAQSDSLKLKRSLRKGELKKFITLLRRFFALIPYQLRKKADEAYYHSLFQLLLSLVGVKMVSEASTDKGRIDGLIEFPNKIYIIEFKYARKGTMQYLHKSAFQQMKNNKYGEGFEGSKKAVTYLAVGFLDKKKNKENKLTLEIDGVWNDKPEYPVKLN